MLVFHCDPVLRLRIAVEAVLERHAVISWGDADDLVRALREHVPNVVVMAVSCPGLDGFDLMRSGVVPRDVPVVMTCPALDAYLLRMACYENAAQWNHRMEVLFDHDIEQLPGLLDELTMSSARRS